MTITKLPLFNLACEKNLFHDGTFHPIQRDIHQLDQEKQLHNQPYRQPTSDAKDYTANIYRENQI